MFDVYEIGIVGAIVGVIIASIFVYDNIKKKEDNDCKVTEHIDSFVSTNE